MAPRRETTASRAQGKRPAKPSQPDEAEAPRKARFDTDLFTSMEEYQRYKQKFAQRKVVPGRNINFSQLQHFGFEGLFPRMGWLPLMTISEPIFLTLVRTFYSWVTYGHGGPIISTVRGVQIKLDLESTCLILDIAPVGLRVYESKAWPTMAGFEPTEAIQRMCSLADAQGMGKPSAHSLPVRCRVLHLMILYILLPWGGHRDEVSYLEAFLIDSIMTGRRIDVGYLMMMHMMACCESSNRIVPYDRFLTRVFKDAVMIHTMSSHWTGWSFEKAPDGSWIRKAKRPIAQPGGQGEVHPTVEEEAEIREIEGGVDPQRDFDHRETKFDIPPQQS